MKDMPEAGMPAPGFELPSDEGESVSLAGLRGTPVVLYFYPKDDTPGCTTQACEFRDSWSDVKRRGAVVLGVSPDSVRSHGRFRKKFELPFALLADEDHSVAEAYGVWGEKTFFGRKYDGVHRTTFLIGPDGRIARVFRNVKPEGHAAEVLEALDAL
jgi:peroxiredoxin Q/BCP